MKLKPDLTLRLSFLIAIVIFSGIDAFGWFGNQQQFDNCSAETNLGSKYCFFEYGKY
jgi:hypothetical protein